MDYDDLTPEDQALLGRSVNQQGEPSMTALSEHLALGHEPRSRRQRILDQIKDLPKDGSVAIGVAESYVTDVIIGEHIPETGRPHPPYFYWWPQYKWPQ